MNVRAWRELIVSAANNTDKAQLDSLAHHLAECETANQILRSKGYGAPGQTIDVAVRQVPDAR